MQILGGYPAIDARFCDAGRTVFKHKNSALARNWGMIGSHSISSLNIPRRRQSVVQYRSSTTARTESNKKKRNAAHSGRSLWHSPRSPDRISHDQLRNASRRSSLVDSPAPRKSAYTLDRNDSICCPREFLFSYYRDPLSFIARNTQSQAVVLASQQWIDSSSLSLLRVC